MAKKNATKATTDKEVLKAAATETAPEDVGIKEVGGVANTGDIVKGIAELSKDTDRKISQADAAHVLRLLIQVVGKEIAKGKRVQLTGLVSFYPSYRGPRKGNNVLTGEAMDIPAGVALMAKAAGSLKNITHDMNKEMVNAVKLATE